MASGRDFDPERGMRLRLDALDIFRAVDDRRGIGVSLWAIGGSAAAIRSDPDAARAHLREASGLLEEIGDSSGAGWVHMSLGLLEASTGHLPEAHAELLKGAAIFVADEDLGGQLLTIRNFGALASLSGDAATAVRLDAAVVRLARRIGVDPPDIEPTVGPIEAAKARLSPEAIARETAAAEAIEPRAFLEGLLAEHAARPGAAQ